MAPLVPAPWQCGEESPGDPERFSIEPALALTRGGFAPPRGQAIFGSLGDSAPDTWGRRLMQRAERRLWAGKEGWTLSPVYDLNPTPIDLKARVLTTNIDLDEGTCSLDLLESASEYFGLALRDARSIIKEVAAETSRWRETAKELGARSPEISRMASAFEHDDLNKALTL